MLSFSSAVDISQLTFFHISLDLYLHFSDCSSLIWLNVDSNHPS